MHSNSSVMQKCSLILLIKISNCAVSNTSVLLSKAIEKHLNVFAVFNRFSCKLAAMVFILRTVEFFDMGIASIFDFTSEHTMLIASTMQFFTNSASEKGLLPFAILCAKTKLAFVADFQLLCRKLLAKVLMFCYKMFLNIIFFEHHTRFITNQAGSFWWTSVCKKILLCPFLVENTAFRIHFAFLVTHTDGFITGVGKLWQHALAVAAKTKASSGSFTMLEATTCRCCVRINAILLEVLAAWKVWLALKLQKSNWCLV